MTVPNRVSREMFRSALARAGLTQRGAARVLDINERTVRRYAAGAPVPRVVWLALEALTNRLSSGGEVCPPPLPGSVVVFDDYGFRRYRESALTHQRFLKGKEQVLELPTGQGLLVKA